MKIIFSEKIKKQYKKIKDKKTRLKIIKQLSKLSEKPVSGKPLKNNLKNHRSLRIPPHRIIYKIENKTIIVNCFEHRKKIYENVKE